MERTLEKHSIWTGIQRGLLGTCPNCGAGRLFRGFLTVRDHCESCGADNTIYPSDDMPPYLTILVAGHLIVPLFMWSDRALEPSVWVQAAIWLPVTLALCLALLPRMKGAVVGFCWATNMVRQDRAR